MEGFGEGFVEGGVQEGVGCQEAVVDCWDYREEGDRFGGVGVVRGEGRCEAVPDLGRVEGKEELDC